MAVRGGLDYLIKVTDQFTPTLSNFIKQVKAGQVEMRRLKNDIGKGLKVRGGGGFKRFKKDIKDANRAVKDLIRTMRTLKTGAGTVRNVGTQAQNQRLRVQNNELRRQLALVRKINRARKTLNVEQAKGGRTLSKILKIYAAMFIVVQGIQAAARAAFKIGTISASLQRAEASLAGVLNANFDIQDAQGKTLEGAESLAAAYKESKRQIQFLVKEAKGLATATELASGLTSVTAASAGALQGDSAIKATLTLMRVLKTLPDIPNPAEELRNITQGKARAGQTQLAGVAGGAPSVNKAIQAAIAKGGDALGDTIERIFAPLADSRELLFGKLPILIERMKAAFEGLLLGEGSPVVDALRRTAAALITFMESAEGSAMVGVLFRLLSGVIDSLSVLTTVVLVPLLSVLNLIEGVVNAALYVFVGAVASLATGIEFLINKIPGQNVDVGAAQLRGAAKSLANQSARSLGAAIGISTGAPSPGVGKSSFKLTPKEKSDIIQQAKEDRAKVRVNEAILELKLMQAKLLEKQLAGTLDVKELDKARLEIQNQQFKVKDRKIRALKIGNRLREGELEQQNELLALTSKNAKIQEDRAAEDKIKTDAAEIVDLAFAEATALSSSVELLLKKEQVAKRINAQAKLAFELAEDEIRASQLSELRIDIANRQAFAQAEREIRTSNSQGFVGEGAQSRSNADAFAQAERELRQTPIEAAAAAFVENVPTEFEFALQTMNTLVQGFASTTAALFANLFSLESAEDALDAFAQFFKKFAEQIIAQLIAIGIAKAFAQIGGGGSGTAASAGGVGTGLTRAFNKGGRVQAFADGGQVHEFKRPSDISPKDTVPAWLTPNEWVIKTESARAYGHDVMDAINRGMIDPLALKALAGAGSMRGMGRGMSRWGYAAGGRVSDRPSTQSAQPTVSASRSYVVANEQEFDRMLSGGSDAFMRFMSRNRTSVNTSLKNVRGA